MLAVQGAQVDLTRLVETNHPLLRREAASSLAMSVGKVNYCLRALVARGLVKSQNYWRSGNKLAYVYLLMPAGVAAKAELAQDFLARKTREYDALRREIEQLQHQGTAAQPPPLACRRVASRRETVPGERLGGPGRPR